MFEIGGIVLYWKDLLMVFSIALIPSIFLGVFTNWFIKKYFYPKVEKKDDK